MCARSRAARRDSRESTACQGGGAFVVSTGSRGSEACLAQRAPKGRGACRAGRAPQALAGTKACQAEQAPRALQAPLGPTASRAQPDRQVPTPLQAPTDRRVLLACLDPWDLRARWGPRVCPEWPSSARQGAMGSLGPGAPTARPGQTAGRARPGSGDCRGRWARAGRLDPTGRRGGRATARMQRWGRRCAASGTSFPARTFGTAVDPRCSATRPASGLTSDTCV